MLFFFFFNSSLLFSFIIINIIIDRFNTIIQIQCICVWLYMFIFVFTFSLSFRSRLLFFIFLVFLNILLFLKIFSFIALLLILFSPYFLSRSLLKSVQYIHVCLTTTQTHTSKSGPLELFGVVLQVYCKQIAYYYTLFMLILDN